MTSLFGDASTKVASVSGNLVRQSFTATAGQTIFNLTTFTYTPGTNALQVFIAGLKKVVGVEYTETSTTRITLAAGATAGQVVEIIGFPLTSAQVVQFVPSTDSVTSSKIVAEAVTVDKIADASVTLAKINPEVYGASGANKLLQLTADGKLPQLDASNLINVSAATNQIQEIIASVASNALTVALAPTSLDFRSATLANGAVNTRVIASALSLTIPSSATLGTTSAQISKIAVLAIDVAGTVELAVVNAAGGINLTESGVINTTAITAAATSASTVYSTAARTSVPYRLVGYVESTQATAGTWATAPSTVQGAGNYVKFTPSLNKLTSTTYATNTTHNITVSGTRPVLIMASYNGGISGNANVNGEFKWGFGSLTDSRGFANGNVDYQTPFGFSIQMVLEPTGSTNLQINTTTASLDGGYGAPSNFFLTVLEIL